MVATTLTVVGDRAGRTPLAAPRRVSPSPTTAQAQRLPLFTTPSADPWSEAEVARAVHAHAAHRGRSAPTSGVPDARVTDAPMAGTYLASRPLVDGNLIISVVEHTRLLGWEQVALTAHRILTVRADASGALAVVDDRPLGRSDLWDLEPLRGARKGPALVVGDVAPALLDRLATVGALAVPRVTRFWGSGWGQRVVIVAPRTLQEFADQLDDATAVATGFVAVTAGTGPMTGGQRPAPGTFIGSRVYVNPDAWAELTTVGQQIVLTHEATHVAAQTVSRPAPPTWLSEGVADRVGFTGSGLPERAVAEAVLDAVRRGDLPGALPAAADFTGADRDVGAVAYAGADVAVWLIARQYGLPALRAVFGDATLRARAGEGSDVALREAFARDLHTTLAAFTGAWRAELTRLADGSPLPDG